MNESILERKERRKLFFMESMFKKCGGIKQGTDYIKKMESRPITKAWLECMYVIDFDKQEKIEEI